MQSYSLTICTMRNSNLLNWRWWSELDRNIAWLLCIELWNFMSTIFSINKNFRWKRGFTWTFCCYLSDCIRWQFSREGRKRGLNLLWWSEKKGERAQQVISLAYHKSLFLSKHRFNILWRHIRLQWLSYFCSTLCFFRYLLHCDQIYFKTNFYFQFTMLFTKDKVLFSWSENISIQK